MGDVDLVTITFSKTLGSCGGALVGSAAAVELLTLDSDPLIFTASNPRSMSRVASRMSSSVLHDSHPPSVL